MCGCSYLYLTERDQKRNIAQVKVFNQPLSSLWKTVYLSGIIRHQMTKRANFIKRVRNEDLPNSVVFTVKIMPFL